MHLRFRTQVLHKIVAIVAYLYIAKLKFEIRVRFLRSTILDYV